MPPDGSRTREDLERTALELFAAQGFAATTITQIAERAGVSDRTYFRHFVDKREVLFSGAAELRQTIETAIHVAPAGATAMEVATDALHAMAFLMEQRRELVRARQPIIDSDPDLQERELLKAAALTSTMESALQRRGYDDQTSSLTAQISLGSFAVAFTAWADEDAGPISLRESITRTLRRLAELTPAPAGSAG